MKRYITPKNEVTAEETVKRNFNKRMAETLYIRGPESIDLIEEAELDFSKKPVNSLYNENKWISNQYR